LSSVEKRGTQKEKEKKKLRTEERKKGKGISGFAGKKNKERKGGR